MKRKEKKKTIIRYQKIRSFSMIENNIYADMINEKDETKLSQSIIWLIRKFFF